MGRTAVTSGQDDAIHNGLDGRTGEEAEGFLTMVLPELGGRVLKARRIDYRKLGVRGSELSEGIAS